MLCIRFDRFTSCVVFIRWWYKLNQCLNVLHITHVCEISTIHKYKSRYFEHPMRTHINWVHPICRFSSILQFMNHRVRSANESNCADHKNRLTERVKSSLFSWSLCVSIAVCPMDVIWFSRDRSLININWINDSIFQEDTDWTLGIESN
jgi:hypothetical protein